MKTFLIQTVNGRIIFDFAFQLLEAINYQNWYHNKKCFHYILSDSDDMPNCIPVGSVEFVLNYLKKHYGVEGVKPINIPPELMRPVFLKREAKIVKKVVDMGYQYFDWNVSSTDAEKVKQDKDVIVSAVLEETKNKDKAIILMYDSAP